MLGRADRASGEGVIYADSDADIACCSDIGSRLGRDPTGAPAPKRPGVQTPKRGSRPRTRPR